MSIFGRGCLQMKAYHLIQGIRSHVWRCRQPQVKPGRMSIFYRGCSRMKLSTGYTVFDPVSGHVINRRGNQVEMPIFGRGCSQMKLSTGYEAFDPASGDVVSRRGNQVKCPFVQRSQMKADHWIRIIRSRVWRCRQPQGKPGRMSVCTALTNES
jgi:hypothetical protein